MRTAENASCGVATRSLIRVRRQRSGGEEGVVVVGQAGVSVAVTFIRLEGDCARLEGGGVDMPAAARRVESWAGHFLLCEDASGRPRVGSCSAGLESLSQALVTLWRHCSMNDH